VCLSIHQDFVDPDPAVRQRQVEHTIKCIDIAALLGVSCVRINSGRWNTIASFDDLMKARGEEPVLPGYTEEQGFRWCIECLEKCLPHAAAAGVTLAVENHWNRRGDAPNSRSHPFPLFRFVDGYRQFFGESL
jgi:sugar phosphate isomerase/epimerase